MSLTRLNPIVSRLLVNNLARQTSLYQSCYGPAIVSNRLIHRNRKYDDSFFNVASNLMRNLESEFNQMKNSLLRNSVFPPISRVFELPSAFEKLTTQEDLITVDEQGNRKFQLNIDLKGFEPEEINVETKGQLLTISAKKEQKSKDSYVLREFSQSYSLPEDLKLEDLKSKWLEGCVLSIEAPLPKLIEGEKPKQLKEKEIPIKHQKKSEASEKKA